MPPVAGSANPVFGQWLIALCPGLSSVLTAWLDQASMKT